MNQKATFQFIFGSLAVLFLLLPPLAALNSIMTHIFDRAAWYQPIETYVVPWEARIVSASLVPLGIETRVTPNDPGTSLFMIKHGAAIPVDLAWNCLGWQSMLLLIVSLFAGLRGSFSWSSRMICILFGIFGTVVVNVFRMTFIATGIYYINNFFGMIIHDYFAAFITMIWLLFFWWFSYAAILIVKPVVSSE